MYFYTFYLYIYTVFA